MVKKNIVNVLKHWNKASGKADELIQELATDISCNEDFFAVVCTLNRALELHVDHLGKQLPVEFVDRVKAEVFKIGR